MGYRGKHDVKSKANRACQGGHARRRWWAVPARTDQRREVLDIPLPTERQTSRDGFRHADDQPASDAREKAAELAKVVRTPIDQRNEAKERDQRKAGDTFKELATAYVETHRAGWRNVKHPDQWTNTLTTYAHPFIGSKLASELNINDVLAILKPIWSTKTETETATIATTEKETVMSLDHITKNPKRQPTLYHC